MRYDINRGSELDRCDHEGSVKLTWWWHGARVADRVLVELSPVVSVMCSFVVVKCASSCCIKLRESRHTTLELFSLRMVHVFICLSLYGKHVGCKVNNDAFAECKHDQRLHVLSLYLQPSYDEVFEIICVVWPYKAWVLRCCNSVFRPAFNSSVIMLGVRHQPNCRS